MKKERVGLPQFEKRCWHDNKLHPDEGRHRNSHERKGLAYGYNDKRGRFDNVTKREDSLTEWSKGF